MRTIILDRGTVLCKKFQSLRYYKRPVRYKYGDKQGGGEIVGNKLYSRGKGLNISDIKLKDGTLLCSDGYYYKKNNKIIVVGNNIIKEIEKLVDENPDITAEEMKEEIKEIKVLIGI